MFNPISTKLIVATTVAAVSIFNSQSPATAAFFMGLGDLPGGDFVSSATGVSADGSVAVGIVFSGEVPLGEGFRWTAQTGLVGLGDLPGGEKLSAAFGVSADGSVIAGTSTSAASNASNPPLESLIWTAQTGLVPLGDLPGGTFSSFTNGISADGSTVLGNSDSTLGRQAFRWTAQTGMVGLGDFAGGIFNSTATSASSDGAIVVGSGNNDLGVEAFRWTESTGLEGLGHLAGGEFFSRAFGISDDGLTIVGRSSSANSLGQPITNSSGTEAFLWTTATGMLALGDLPGGNFFSRAIAVSGDGSIIVGQSESDLGEEPFIWDSTQGIRPLVKVLTDDFGLDLSGWTSLTVTDISADETTFVGFGTNPTGNLEGWIANIAPQSPSVPEPSSGWGMLGFIGSLAVASLIKDLKVKLHRR